MHVCACLKNAYSYLLLNMCKALFNHIGIQVDTHLADAKVIVEAY